MSVELRQETPCYYSSPKHQQSFYGRYIYIYEGRGTLHVDGKGLRLYRRSQILDIPFTNIKSVGLKSFSRMAKPGGLTYLVIKYATDWEDDAEIHLIPFRSCWNPTWETSRIVESWYDTLSRQEELEGRIEPPSYEADGVPAWKGGVIFAIAILLPIIVSTTFLLYVTSVRH